MYELALCAGIGGISLGLKRAGSRTVCYVEIADYPCRVLEERIRDGELDDAPIWDDIRTFDGMPWRGSVDIATCGFPCQPFSTAGKRRGAQDERYLWESIIRIVCEVRPRYLLLENVPGLLSLERGRMLGSILADVAAWLSDCGGGRIESLCLRASDFGAPHIRERLFILAYPLRTERGSHAEGWHVTNRDDARRQKTTGGFELRSAGVVAYPKVTEQQCAGAAREWIPGFANGGSSLANAMPPGWQECEPATVARGARYAPWRRTAPGDVEYPTGARCRQVELPAAGVHAQPDSSGTEQGALLESVLNRNARLKSLGNAVAPQVAEYIGRLIITQEALCRL